MNCAATVGAFICSGAIHRAYFEAASLPPNNYTARAVIIPSATLRGASA